MKTYHYILIVCTLGIAILILYILTLPKPYPNLAMMVSVSSDGKYALSSHHNRKLILWDIAHKKHRIVSENTNIYSAYFIKNTDRFMWQDLHNIVHIQNTHGRTIRTFALPYPTYGQVITSDLQHYFASDSDWQLLTKTKTLIQKTLRSVDFLGVGKLLNLTLSDDDRFLLASGNGTRSKNIQAVTLWNTKTKKLLRMFPGNISKTIATISPDGHYVVAGDESGIGFAWNLPTQNLQFEIQASCHNAMTTEIGTCITMEKTDPHIINNPILQIKFVDATHYLIFTPVIAYAILYDTSQAFPLKFLKLSEHPYPAITQYDRASAIDSAPKAHILVLGQAIQNGIIVYQYHDQTLTKIWSPIIK